MISSFIYLLVYFFEQIISYIFFNNKYKKKISLKLIAICYFFSGTLQFLISFIDNPVFNSLTFFIMNLLIALICFNINLSQSIWSSLSLTIMMGLSEMVIIYLFTFFFGLHISLITTQSNVLVFATLGTKALYFILALIFSKLSFKEHKGTKDSKLYIALFLLPFASIVIIFIFSTFTVENSLSANQSTYLIIISNLLLFSNAVVFLVHEQLTQIQQRNLELSLEHQKKEINMEHYEQLKKQYENSAILIHDTQRCLATITELAAQADDDAIIEYIHSFSKTNQIKGLRKYSSNKLINVIATRYCELCREKDIITNIDIRNIDLNFITDGDLTAILDNLLENAFESAQQTAKGFINLNIDEINENFVIIKLQNSCSVPPKIKDGKIVTSKTNLWHGYGLVSVQRSIEHYNGDIKFSYNESNQLFQVSVFLYRF